MAKALVLRHDHFVAHCFRRKTNISRRWARINHCILAQCLLDAPSPIQSSPPAEEYRCTTLYRAPYSNHQLLGGSITQTNGWSGLSIGRSLLGLACFEMLSFTRCFSINSYSSFQRTFRHYYFGSPLVIECVQYLSLQVQVLHREQYFLTWPLEMI